LGDESASQTTPGLPDKVGVKHVLAGFAVNC
jgi:hypothetical protein